MGRPASARRSSASSTSTGRSPRRMVNNLDWTAQLSALDLLRDIGKHFPVNRMLDREAVSARLAAGGICYTEFSYQILQSLDFLELYRRYGCVLQTGGSDQWGNITAGVDLIRRVTRGSRTGSPTRSSTPLLTKADGTKFGKTADGAVWLDPELTSPYAFYQYCLNVDDADVSSLLRYFTFRTRERDRGPRGAGGRAAGGPGGAAGPGRGPHRAGARGRRAARRPSRPAGRCSGRATSPRCRWARSRRRCARPAWSAARPGGHDRGPARGDRAGGEQGRRPPHGGRGRGVPQQRPGRGPRRGARRRRLGWAGGSSCCAAAARPSRGWSTRPERGIAVQPRRAATR